MNTGGVVYHEKIGGHDVVVRYPKASDLKSMHEYINTISKEKTYITFQGEQISLEDEKKYVDGQLKKINKKKCVHLLVFVNDKLSGTSSIDLGEKIKSHIGGFGVTIAKEERGKGLGKLLMKLILEEAKNNLPKLKIVILEIFAENERAKRMYESFGFQEYGRLPNGIQYKDIFTDGILMYKEF